MKNDKQDKEENRKEKSLTAADIIFKWYTCAAIGFALGSLLGDLTTACIGLIIGAAAGGILQKVFLK